MTATTTEGTGNGSGHVQFIRNGIVRTDNIADHNVTRPKLSDDAVSEPTISLDYGSFYSDQIQTNSPASTPRAMTLNREVTAKGVYVVSSTMVTVEKEGVYNIQFSAQLDKTDSGTDLADIWLAIQGEPVEWSNTQISVVGNNGKYVAAWNWVVPLDAGQHFQIYWQSEDANMRIVTRAINGSIPAVPSLILTVTQVG